MALEEPKDRYYRSLQITVILQCKRHLTTTSTEPSPIALENRKTDACTSSPHAKTNTEPLPALQTFFLLIS